MKSRWDKLSDLSHHFCPRRAGNALQQWFSTTPGQYVLRTECQLLEALGEGLSGYHMMQLSYASEQQPICSFRHTHCFNLSAGNGLAGNAVTEYEALPLPSETIDTGLLHHVLEYSHNPHRILSEVSRVIIPGGHLVLVTFNPVSLLGLLRWPIKPFSDAPVWHYRGLRAGRIIDWLQLLHFQPVAAAMGNVLFPLRCQHPLSSKYGVLRKLGNAGILLGAVSVVVARKTVLRPVQGNGFPQLAKQAVGLNLRYGRDAAKNKAAKVTEPR